VPALRRIPWKYPETDDKGQAMQKIIRPHAASGTMHLQT
jgi:hypothetical protein